MIALRCAALLRSTGKSKQASDIAMFSLEWNKDDTDLKIELARNHICTKNFREAATILEGVKLSKSNEFSAWFNLGVAYSNLGELNHGLEAFNKAHNIKPQDVATAANRIVLLKETRQICKAREALESLPKEISRKEFEILGAEAGVLMAEQNYDQAGKIFRLLCTRKPLDATNWLNYAACIRANKLTVDPDLVLRTALRLNPDDISLIHSWLQSLCEMGKLDQARRLLSTMDRNDFTSKDTHLFNLLFLSTSNSLMPEAQLLKLASRWETQNTNKFMNSINKDHIHGNLSDKERKLRVGYLSSDYCNHPVARFLQPILENHDKSKVEIWCIHTGPNWDKQTEKIKSLCDHWLDLTNFDDEIATRVVADQRLDILIELGGFTGNNRISICLSEPAYVQMSYLGYPGPTYLKSIPWWIGDKTLFSELDKETKKQHKLAFIKDGYMALPRPSECTNPSRIAENRFVFGSYNHARKITDDTILLWCKLLDECKDSILLLKSISFKHTKEQDAMMKRFQKYGLCESRLILRPFTAEFKSHLKAYNNIDISLDPIPYGGATTTAEALWMGVPVVCKTGPSMASNLAASILKSANCVDWIAKDSEEYIKTAKNLYSKGIRTDNHRHELLKKITLSPLNKPQRVSKELERIYFDALLYTERSFS